jgi:sulfur carrier protein ThiS
MGIKEIDGRIEEVTLIRPGIGAETMVVPEGSSLSELLRQADIETDQRAVFIDQKPISDHVVVKTGMVITIVPQPKNAAESRSWKHLVGNFHDDPAFEEMMQAVQAERDAEKEQS